MLKAVFGLVVALTAVSSPGLPAGETDWKDETPQAAERQLEKMRAAAGTLDRFEIECVVWNLDNTFATEKRWYLHLYADETVGSRWEIRPVHQRISNARRTTSGRRCELTTTSRETLICKGDTCIDFHGTERTYETLNAGPKSRSAPLKAAPHQLLPPWLDPSVDWKDLKSRCTIKRASGDDSVFFVEFSLEPRTKPQAFRENIDERLVSTNELRIDRKTNLPRQWRMVRGAGAQDQIVFFERIDLRPAKHELEFVLIGYEDAALLKFVVAAQGSEPAANDNGEPLRTIQFVAGCVRALWYPP